MRFGLCSALLLICTDECFLVDLILFENYCKEINKLLKFFICLLCHVGWQEKERVWRGGQREFGEEGERSLARGAKNLAREACEVA